MVTTRLDGVVSGGERIPMHGVKETFDAIASGYDDQRRWIIPDLQGFYGAAVWAAALPAKRPSILDIGVGTDVSCSAASQPVLF